MKKSSKPFPVKFNCTGRGELFHRPKKLSEAIGDAGTRFDRRFGYAGA
jgi:hypothetical protein